MPSHIFSFKTGLSVGIKELNFNFKNLDIKNSYPVPVKNELVIVLASTESGKSLFTLVDEAGKNVLSESKNVLIGEDTYKLNVSKLKKGIYILKVELNTNAAIRKIEIE